MINVIKICNKRKGTVTHVLRSIKLNDSDVKDFSRENFRRCKRLYVDTSVDEKDFNSLLKDEEEESTDIFK